MNNIKYSDLFPKNYYVSEAIAKELQNKIDDALGHLQRGTALDVKTAIRILSCE